MDVFYRRLIILFIFLFIFCVSINTMFVAINHFKLHEFCKEYGYEDGKCNDKKVIAAMSRYSVLIALFSGISILTTGFWASVSNRLGRKNIILITLFGAICGSLGWSLMYTYDSLLKEWKTVVIVGWTLMAMTGGMLVLLLAIFGSLTDISVSRAHIRPYLFASMDGLLSIAGILGVQIPAFLITYDPRYITYFVSISMIALWFYCLFFIKDTTPKAIQKLPIDWSRAHVIGSVLFMCPVGHTKKILREDAQLVHEHLLGEYNQALIDNEYSVTHIRPNNSAAGDDNGTTTNMATSTAVTSTTDRSNNVGDLNDINDDDLIISEDNTMQLPGYGGGINAEYHPGTKDKQTKTTKKKSNKAKSKSAKQTNPSTNTLSQPLLSDDYNDDGAYNDSETGPVKRVTFMKRAGSNHSTDEEHKRRHLTEADDDYDYYEGYSTEAILEDQLDALSSALTADITAIVPQEGVYHQHNDDCYGVIHEEGEDEGETTTTEEGGWAPVGLVCIPDHALTEPEYIEPGNAIYLLGLLTGIVLALTMGQRTVAFLYLKQEFSISAHFYSNLLTFEMVVRGIGTFALLPILRPRIKTRMQELRVVMISMVVKAIFLGCIPLSKNIWLTFALCLLSQFSSCLVSGFTRGLISNEVSTKLQGRILGGLASLDVIMLTFGGVGYNMLFNWSSESFPGLTYLLMSGLSLLGAVLPLFLSDSTEVFNKRKFGGVAYHEIAANADASSEGSAEVENNNKNHSSSMVSNDYSVNGGNTTTSSDNKDTSPLLPSQITASDDDNQSPNPYEVAITAAD